MRRFYGLLIAIAVFITLTGCGMQLPGWAPEPTPTESLVDPTAMPSAFDPLIEEDLEPQCAYVWASRPLPEYTDLLMAAYRSAGIEGVQADVSAYGENCVDVESKQILRFLTMRSEFYISLSVDDLENKDALSRQLMTVMAVLQRFPPDTFPGPEISTVVMRFESGDDSSILSFRMDEFEQALEDGLRGAAIYEALD
jgi:hypothetical protein